MSVSPSSSSSTSAPAPDTNLLPFTSDPFRLALKDLALFFRITVTWPPTTGLPSIILPFYPFKSGRLDELYPSFPNLSALVLHLILLVFQLSFVLALVPSLIFGLPLPFLGWTPTCLLILIGVGFANAGFCTLLNGRKREFESYVDPDWEVHGDEKWLFVNGVAVGGHWMQSNLDRLAATFRRPVLGIHNQTRGIIFDVFEVIVQRTFGYATADVRDVYARVLEFVNQRDEKGERRWKKIVLILHSQGGVEGGLVVDWLLATVGQELLECIEIYTFGNAANHFNSPQMADGNRVIRHIEHYANLGDYVSLFGILNFRPLPWKVGELPARVREVLRDRYVGRVFVRKAGGHQMNGNYLDNFFEMSTTQDERLIEVKEDNEFMSAELNESLLQRYDVAGKVIEKDVWMLDNSEASIKEHRQIKDVSRLWLYRNGLSPPED